MSTLFYADCLVQHLDCPGFRAFSRVHVFSRPRRQFKSHLGHANPLVRGGFALSACTKLWPVDSDGWFAGFGLAAAVAYSGVWVAG